MAEDVVVTHVDGEPVNQKADDQSTNQENEEQEDKDISQMPFSDYLLYLYCITNKKDYTKYIGKVNGGGSSHIDINFVLPVLICTAVIGLVLVARYKNHGRPGHVGSQGWNGGKNEYSVY